MTLGAGSVAVINGDVDISEWDDEELAYGRRRDKNGHFTGHPPKVVPAECMRELNRRKLFETNSIIRDACTDAAQYLADVVRGEENPNNARQSAASTILDRFLGKPKERIDIEHELKEPAWIGVLRRATSLDGQTLEQHPITRNVMSPIPATSRPVEPEDIVDAQLIEDDPVLWDEDDLDDVIEWE